MINSTAFDYVNVLTKRKAADASFTKEKLYLQTIYRMWIPRATSARDLNSFEGTVTGAWQMQASVSRLIKNK